MGFTVITLPTITNFSPLTGVSGDAVTITGRSLDDVTSVRFNGVGASFAISSDTSITAIVPSGCSSGLIEVVTPVGVARSSLGFTIETSGGGGGGGVLEAATKYPETLEEKQLSFWRFEEITGNRRDRIGSNHLKPTGTVERVAGKVGFAIKLDGSSYLSLAATTSNLTIGAEQSIEWHGWFYALSIADSRIFTRKNEYHLEIKNSKLKWTVVDGTNNLVSVEHVNTLRIGVWYKFGVWFDFTNSQIGITVNDLAQNTATCTSTYDSTSDEFYIGASNSTVTSDRFLGYIDAIGCWRRTLTAVERQYLYNNSFGTDIPPTISATQINKRDVQDTLPAGGQTFLWDSGSNSYRIGYPVYNEALLTYTYNNNIILLLHMEGSNNSSGFGDSARGQSPNIVGKPIIKTSEFKFSSSSAYFDGSSYLIYKNSTLNLGSSWTIDLFFNAESVTKSPTLFYFYKDLNKDLRLFIDNGTLKLKTGSSVLINTNTTIATDTWYHVAIAKSGSIIRLFLDGVQIGSYTSSTFALPQNNPDFIIGSIGYGSSSNDYYHGYIDELRLIRNQAEYTTNFAPLTAPFPNPQAIDKPLNNNARVEVAVNGADIGMRRKINLVESSLIQFEVTDDPIDEKLDVEIFVTGNGLGEVNTASNVGNAGECVFKQKTGADLEFKKLLAGTNINLVPTANDEIQFNVSALGEVNTASNVGGVVGVGIFKQKGGVNLQFKKLLAGTNISITPTATDEIEISATGNAAGEVNTGSNIGTTGIGFFKDKSNEVLRFKNAAAASTKIQIGEDTTNNLVRFDAVEANFNLANFGGNLPLTKGGTGATTASVARTNLGLGNAAVFNTTDTVFNASHIRGIIVDDSNIANNRILQYQQSTNSFVYIDPPSSGSAGGSGGGATLTRSTVSHTTQSLAPNAIENALIALGSSFELLLIETDKPLWIRIYATLAARTADSSRTSYNSIAPASIKPWIIFEGFTDANNLVIPCRKVFGANLESAASSNIPIAIANLSSTNSTVTATFTKITIES